MTQALSPTLQLACDLIRRASITPEDAGCQELMCARLEPLGFRCETLVFAEVTNLWAVRGDTGPLLVFAGHTDVVPPGPPDAWTSPPFEPQIRDGFLYGRGAADMKGSLAAMLVAVENFVARHPDHQGRIGFLITSDEEGPSVNGTLKVMEHLQAQGEQIDWCLVGEPSSTKQVGDTVKNGRRGSLGAKLLVKGIQGHIAYPEKALNPVHIALAALQELVAEHWDDGNAFFPATSMQISNIHGGTGATNVIPGNLEVLFNFRYSSELSADQLIARTEAILQRHRFEYALHWTRFGDPFLTPPGTLVEAVSLAIEKVTGIRTTLSTSGGTSDGRFIAPSGAQVVELGPCNDSIHKVNERVQVRELEQLQDIYYELLKGLLPSKA